jgi:hypothetical protein
MVIPHFITDILTQTLKKFHYGIVPHYNDWNRVKDWYKGRTDIAD